MDDTSGGAQRDNGLKRPGDGLERQQQHQQHVCIEVDSDDGGPLSTPVGFSMEACLNTGRPIQVEWDGKSREFTDGFGLCSPTRWPPRSRGTGRSSAMRQLCLSTYELLQRAVRDNIVDIRLEAMKLVTGKLQSSPFSAECLKKLRAKWAPLVAMAPSWG